MADAGRKVRLLTVCLISRHFLLYRKLFNRVRLGGGVNASRRNLAKVLAREALIRGRQSVTRARSPEVAGS